MEENIEKIGSIEEIIKKINDEGNKEVERIKLENEKEIERLNEIFEKMADEEAEKIKKNAYEEISLIKKQIISNAQLEAKDRIDREKFTWVENVFKEARQTILNFDDKEKKKILERMCDIPEKENFVFYVDKKYAHMINNKDIDVKISDINDFGVIIKSKDGKITIDNTLTNWLNILKASKRSEVAKILFEK